MHFIVFFNTISPDYRLRGLVWILHLEVIGILNESDCQGDDLRKLSMPLKQFAP